MIHIPKRLFSEFHLLRNTQLAKPLVYTSDNLMLNVFRVKPNPDYARRHGIMVFQMMPCVKEPGTDRYSTVFHKRLQFVVGLQNIGNILLLNDSVIAKQPINIDLQYDSRAGTIKRLRLHKLPEQERATLELQTIASGQPIPPKVRPYLGKHRMYVSKGYLVAMRELMSYSLPLMLGWDLNPTLNSQFDYQPTKSTIPPQ